MARARKTEREKQLNAELGAQVTRLRQEKGWTISRLARELGVTSNYLGKLEQGQHGFSAFLLLKLSERLGRPIAAFYPAQRVSHEPEMNQLIHEGLASLDLRSRLEVFELIQRLSHRSFMMEIWKRRAARGGALISLEGIDGVLLNEQAELLVERLGCDPETGDPRGLASLYDFDAKIWEFILTRSPDILGPDGAFERTLLFACERLYRQEIQIRPAIQDGRVVVSPFFRLAASIYQHAEGMAQRTVIDAVQDFLLPTDITIVLESDPWKAAERATHSRPGPGQFYSPYRGKDAFRAALQTHRSLCTVLEARGERVYVVAGDRPPQRVAEDVYDIVREKRAVDDSSERSA